MTNTPITNIMSTAQKNKQLTAEAQEKDILFRESFVFVLDLIEFTELLEQKKKSSLAKQLLKAGTSFGEIINEARFTENNEKYICRLKKLSKNAHNTKYLLQLCKYSATYPNPNDLIADLDLLMEKIEGIVKNSRQ